MKTKNVLTVLLVLALSVGLMSSLAFAQEQKLKLEDYKIQLAEWQKREADAKAKIDQLQKEIDALNQQLADLDKQIEKEWNEIYAMLGTDAAGVEAYRKSLDELENQVDGLSALSSEELFQRRDEIKALEDKLAELKSNNIYLLSEMQDRVAAIEGKLMQIKSRMPKSVYDNYTVLRGDYLWKISKKPDIYGDPMQWMKIYTYNRDLIKNPDLIYPDWVLKIPRKVGPNEYIVMKGDFLRKIASDPQIFGDPTQWTKIYEANKDIISDPNLIYPYEILVIPKE
ncbi:MAG TPA: LysM peptidoglycan-binding domain-containing protein [Bacteroidetes bacterium]|nr:LysM peptidoglycan-binding domain-containing protein [Bacteroidota bacterium]